MTEKIIVGICRFSFLGVGDWQAYSGVYHAEPETLKKVAHQIYDEERLKARFATFENICLPSILAQTDPRFVFIVLSSNAMPDHWRRRLTEICEPHDQIELLWSDMTKTKDALQETLTELHDLSDGQLWQFRLDDDDAIDVNFIARLRRHILRVEEFDNCAISIARGMYVVIYGGHETQYLEYQNPFHGAGLTVKLSQPGRSVFHYGHARIRDKMTNFVDFDSFGALILKWPSDSRPLNLERLPANLTRMPQYSYENKLRIFFPFLKDFDFDSLRPSPRPAKTES